MRRNQIGLVAAVLLVLWLATALVRVENQRYALSLGMCQDTVSGVGSDYKCLAAVETRTAWYWHLFYALSD